MASTLPRPQTIEDKINKQLQNDELMSAPKCKIIHIMVCHLTINHKAMLTCNPKTKTYRAKITWHQKTSLFSDLPFTDEESRSMGSFSFPKTRAGLP